MLKRSKCTYLRKFHDSFKKILLAFFKRLGFTPDEQLGGWEETRYFNKVVVILKYALKGNFKAREGLLTGWAGNNTFK